MAYVQVTAQWHMCDRQHVRLKLGAMVLHVLQFMVLYQLADQLSVNNMFYVDNSNYSNDQVRTHCHVCDPKWPEFRDPCFCAYGFLMRSDLT